MTETPAETSQITVYGATWCPDCRRSKKFLGEHRIGYLNIDIEQHPEAAAVVERLNQGKRVIPTLVFPDGTHLAEPTNAELAQKLGLQTQASRSYYGAIIVGSGPAGLTAALYLAREGIDTLVIERAGLGGQAGVTQRLDNFPGFDEGIGGAEFADRLTRQARRFGVEILQAQEVQAINRDGDYWCVRLGNGKEHATRAVLLATGARYRRLDIPGEEELIGINVHFCATCDGPFYRGKRVLVIGGGNSGFEEGLYLSQLASQVDIVEFAPQAKASQILQDKVAEQPNMRVFLNHAVQQFVGEGRLEGVVVEDRTSGQTQTWQYDGVFIFIGLTPNSDLIRHQAQADAGGFLLTSSSLMTTLPGIFAAGDVRAGSTKQAASAAGEGATAALMMREYLRTTA